MVKRHCMSLGGITLLITLISLLSVLSSLSQPITLAAQSSASPLPTIESSGYGTEMVYVLGGTVEIGASDEQILEACRIFEATDLTHCLNAVRSDYAQEAHEVDVPPFWIDRYEVTNAAYNECVSAGNCPEISSLYRANPSFTEPEKPIIGVTWYEAMMFCNIHLARLPTEAEWEYAARGSQNLIFPWGNYFEDGFIPQDTLHLVGTNPIDISWIGIYDMGGNVAEWVEDRPLASSLPPEMPIEDYYGFDSLRVIKGGSWTASVLSSTTYSREFTWAWNRSDVGIRCARTASP